MSSHNPFIGIRPFAEDDSDRFYGRETDSEALINRVNHFPITILSGPSGYGKSSLVTCGVLKPLKIARLEDREGMSRLPLMVRNWGQARGNAAEVENIGLLFANILRKDAETTFDRDIKLGGRVGEKAASDKAIFDAVVRDCADDLETDPRAFIDLVSGLSREFGGIVLLFDQFEEILRVGSDAVRKVTNLVVQMARVPGVSVLLSLRHEHFAQLRLIESQAGPLAKSTVHLDGMTFKEACHVFQQMAKKENINLGFDLLEHLGNAMPGEADLFFFQAILKEICQALAEDGKPLSVLDRSSLLETFGAEIDENPRAAFGYALLRIVDRCFRPNADHDRATSLRHRSLALRVVPWLSAGGFKTSQGEEDLFQKAFGEALGSAVGVGLAEAMSGSFRLAHSKVRDVDQLKAAIKAEYVVTLERLVEGRILKKYRADARGGNAGEITERAIWELTHDRLGEPLVGWWRDQVNCIKDNRGFPLASRGVTPIRVDRSQRVGEIPLHSDAEQTQASDWRKLNWRGCVVEPRDRLLGAKPKQTVRASFTGITFDDCDFRGSVFRRCEFENCNFTACNLSGVAFIDCRFKSCTFTNIAGKLGNTVGFFACEFEGGVEFLDCELVQFTIADNVLVGSGGIVFKGGKVKSSRFSDRLPKSKGGLKFVGCIYDHTWFDDDFARNHSIIALDG